MDSQAGTWLLLVHITVWIPAQTIEYPGGEPSWITRDTERQKKATHELFDVASPRRVATTGDSTSPLSKQYLTFTDRQYGLDEIRYNLTAFGKDYQFLLKPSRRFIAPSFTVEHFSGNQSMSVPCGSDLSHCYYRGTVLGDPISSAVFDLCNGLRGAFKTRDSVFLVQPLAQNTTPGTDEAAAEFQEKQHLVINHLATSALSSGGSHCGVDDKMLKQPNSGDLPSRSLPQGTNVIHSRRKRATIFQGVQSYPRYVEVMVTTDKSMLDHYGSEFEVKRYIQTIMGVVHDIFLNPDLGHSIEIVLTGIKILKNDRDLRISTDGTTLLRTFCKWQHKQNVESDLDAGHYDTAVLITRKNICRRGGSCETLGLAELGTMCNPARSCSIVEDNGLGVAFTVAHELGHTFNINHDIQSKKCLGEKTSLNVMAPSLNVQSMPWSWSSCSRQEITEFLEQGHDTCLMDKPQYQFKKTDKLPGEIYRPDMQCKLIYGKQSKLCSYEQLKVKECQILWCAARLSNGKAACRSQGMPWAEGSPCGNGQWCVRGSCQPKRTQQKIDGGWSAWTPFGPCSRTCGGGVEYSSRSCNKPSPTYGGRFCIGAKTRFRSCNTRDCPKGSRRFREVQCAAFNGKRGPRGSKWIPLYLKGRYQCQLICQLAGGADQITAKVIDGTKCDKNKFDICVNGICRLAGCDNVLNSRTKLDECGVCGGNNATCERITKTWRSKVRWGYNDVATLYPGYSSIRIEQITPGTKYEPRRGYYWGDDNYLVLRDENNGRILNTGYYVLRSKGEINIEAAGIQITYSGPESYPEYVRIDGKLNKKVYIQVLSVGVVTPPTITYSYLRAVKQTYIWDHKGPWSRCSHECQGWRKRRLVCRRKQDGSLVSWQRCDPRKKPGTIKETCNSHCLFKWMVAGKGACKPGCGPGSQKVFFKCIKHHIRSGANLVRRSRDCRLIARPRSERPCTGTCDNVQWVYSRWSACSKTCGGGRQTRGVTCVEKIAHVRKELPSSMCSRIQKRHLERSCNTQRCPSWRTGKWDQCSAACGEGYQRRKVNCVTKDNTVTRDSACDLKRKPDSKKACQMKACPHWQYGDWSDCSATCGSGHRIRLVRCVDADRGELKDDDCRALPKPSTREQCTNLPHCDKTVYLISKVKVTKKLKWTVGDWGECSVTCGTGHQQRHLRCVDPKGRALHSERCKNISKPPTVQKCAKYCGTWRHSDWTRCSCTKGTQRRQVKCFNKDYRLTEDQMCDPLLQPARVRQCSNYYFCSPPKILKLKLNGRWKIGSWNKCSKTCENGMKRRSVICLDGYSRRDPTEKSCKRTTKPESVTSCNLGSCPQWKIKPWSPCSKTCDLGVVTRAVYCTDNKNRLRDEKCNMKLKPTVKKSCFVKRCDPPPRWAKGEWNPCSVKCGTGVKRRHVWCENHLRKRVPSTQCRSLKRRPKTVKECRRHTCGVWETGLWSACSSKCNVGEQVRNVRCRRSNSFVGDEFCPAKSKPLEKKSCQLRKCQRDHRRYRWLTTDWGRCSKTCGDGVKSRRVFCALQNRRRVTDQNCNADVKPPNMMACNIRECPPKWTVGDWSECSKSCGEGIQTRTVSCPKKDKRSADLCDRRRYPGSRRRCNRGKCNGYYMWKTGPWTQCSATCGWAVKTRAVKCLGRNNYITSDYRCVRSRAIKPDNERKCKLPRCPPKSCRDIQARSGKQEDKEFILTIKNKKIKVYCYNMLSNYPKEYITLVTGPKRNFAEFYHRSLKNPNECPNGARGDHCPQCHSEIFPSSGGTYFSKVRLDVSRMSIIGNDYRFSTTRGSYSRSFGTAGDCYSKRRCPQGRFSIDLTGTGLSIANEVSWRSYGYDLSRVIDIQKGRQIVSGMCGGYCGICRPYRSLRVTV